MFWKILKVMLVMAVLSAGAFALWKISTDIGFWVAVEAALFLVSSYALFVLFAPPRHGAAVANVAGGYRPVGPGVHLIVPGGEWPDEVVYLKKFEVAFVARPDTAGRDASAMRVVAGCEVSVEHLPEYIRCTEGERREAVKNRVEGLLTRLGHLCGSFDALYSSGGNISAKIMMLYKYDSAGGMSLEEYYGLKLNYVIFPDITPPEIVRDAAARKWAAEEQVKTLQIKMLGYETEIDRWVAKDPRCSRSQAMAFLMAETGSIPQSTVNHVYEAGPEISRIVRGIGRRFKGDKS